MSINFKCLVYLYLTYFRKIECHENYELIFLQGLLMKVCTCKS